MICYPNTKEAGCKDDNCTKNSAWMPKLAIFSMVIGLIQIYFVYDMSEYKKIIVFAVILKKVSEKIEKIQYFIIKFLSDLCR